MTADFVARAALTIDAQPSSVWTALVTPEAIKQYMFGTTVVTNWIEGGPIVWKGEWQGKTYEDKGVILRYQPERALQFTHFSPLSGLPDRPEHYHTVTIDLQPDGSRTRVSIAQDNNPTEEAREHSQKNWEVVLAGLETYLNQR